MLWAKAQIGASAPLPTGTKKRGPRGFPLGAHAPCLPPQPSCRYLLSMAARVQCRQVPSRHPGSDLRSGAGPLSPAGCGLELLGALELLPRAGIDRVAAAAHGLPGGELELEHTAVSVVPLAQRTGAVVRFALGDLVPLRPGSTEHGLDLCGAHVAASGAGAASGAAAGARVAAGVTGVARTGIAGVRAARVAGVGAAGVSRLFLLLGALEN